MLHFWVFSKKFSLNLSQRQNVFTNEQLCCFWNLDINMDIKQPFHMNLPTVKSSDHVQTCMCNVKKMINILSLTCHVFNFAPLFVYVFLTRYLYLFMVLYLLTYLVKNSSYYDAFLKNYLELVKERNWKQPLLGI